MSVTRDYTLGKGRMQFRVETESGEGFRDLGNAPDFTLNLTTEKLEHFSSREGISKKDLEVITQTTAGGSFTLDEPNNDNLAMFLLSTAPGSSTQVAAALAAMDDITVGGAGEAFGRWYPVKDAGVATYNLGTVEVRDVTDVIQYVEGPDALGDVTVTNAGNYQLDATGGLIYINTDQTTVVTNPIAAGDVLHIQAQLLDGSKSDSHAFTLTTLKGDLYFVGAPPQGVILDVKGFCTITPSGDFGLISEDWMQMTFDIEFLEVSGIDGVVHVDQRGKVG